MESFCVRLSHSTIIEGLLQQALERKPYGSQGGACLQTVALSTLSKMKAMTCQWGWHYRIRLKKDSWIRRAGIGWSQLKDFHVLARKTFWMTSPMGANLQKSEIRSVPALSRLWFILAVATRLRHRSWC
ncbi:hypothetical protein [Moorena sp. SIOASIH]|uniref:hypothetical protein n=1 Tax=Moorena sp. SIOASIH TaxID=2607817 RepID=UPI00260115AF|nr:hypothetical protein [Moorena sp. SIOASIH]